MARGVARDRTYRRSRGRRFAYRASIPGLVALALHLAFVPVQFLVRASVHAANPRPKVARHSVRQDQRVETYVQFAAPLHPAGPLDLGHGAGYVAAHGNDDSSVRQNRKRGLQIYAVTHGRVLGADAV